MVIKMKKKSLQFNAFISGFQKLFSIIFPLITFPYIARILTVESIGKINFANSLISYFILIAGLGINNYAIREGSQIRNDKNKIEKFSSEIFSINLFSTFISYILLLLIYILWGKLENYSILIVIHSISIIGGTIGINWIYSIYEDYLYVAIRTVVFQFISLILMFIFVKDNGDYFLYTAIVVFANVGSNIFNLFHSKKYLNLKVTLKLNLKKHLKPIMIIFASTVAITIYVNSDITILGWLADDYSVGIYSVSVKVYSILKQVIAALIIVTLPRMSNLLKDNKIDEYRSTVNNFFKLLLLVTLPCAIGIFSVADYIVNLIAGVEYLSAVSSLRILSVSLVFSILSSFVTYTMILPSKNEMIQLIATLVSASVNIIFNIIFIPLFKENAAAFTTLIAELLVFVIEYCWFKKSNLDLTNNILKIKIIDLFSFLVGCIFILFITNIINSLSLYYFIKLVISIFISVFGYLVILILFRNSYIIECIKKIKMKFKF